MNHETLRERIALRTYGELDAEEAAVLEEHLAACEDCRRYAASFAEGLGRIAASARTASDDLPSGWSDRLRDATRESRAGSRARARIPSWWTAVAGFAAGVVATAAIVRGPASRIAPDRSPTAWERFHGETPPPLATSESRLRELPGYLRR